MVDEVLVKEIRRRALFYDKYSGCSQSVLLALQEGLGIGDLESFRAATVLSGGVARRGESCGALVGALMGLSLEEGREKLEDLPQLQLTIADGYALSVEFMRRVEKEYGLKKPLPSTLCRDMQQAIYGRSWNLADAAQRTDFINSGGHGDAGCLKVCGIAAEVAAETILMKREG